MRNIINEFGSLVALDGEYEMFIFATERKIKQLKLSYSRTNSRYNSEIIFKADMSADFSIYWKFYLQCFVNGQLVENYRIHEDVYFLYAKNIENKSNFGGIYQFVYHEHIAAERIQKIKVKPASKISPVRPKSNLLIDIFSQNNDVDQRHSIEGDNTTIESNVKSNLLIDILFTEDQNFDNTLLNISKK